MKHSGSHYLLVVVEEGHFGGQVNARVDMIVEAGLFAPEEKG